MGLAHPLWKGYCCLQLTSARNEVEPGLKVLFRFFELVVSNPWREREMRDERWNGNYIVHFSIMAGGYIYGELLCHCQPSQYGLNRIACCIILF